MNEYVIGVDYGTDSVRSILVNAANGEEVASSIFYYPRWKEGLYSMPRKINFASTRWIMWKDWNTLLKDVCKKLVQTLPNK